MKNWCQSLRFKCNLYRYSEDASSVKMAGGLQWSVPHTLVGTPYKLKNSADPQLERRLVSTLEPMK